MSYKKLVKDLISKYSPVKHEVLFKWGVVFVYTLSCLTGVVSFELWSQVIVIWEKEYDNIINIIMMNHPHLLRFLLVLPVFLLSNILSVDYNYIFSVFVPVLVILSVLNINKVVIDFDEQYRDFEKYILFVSTFIFVASISLFMNGRMLFAIAGGSILLYITHFWDRLKFSSVVTGSFVGLFISSVSSGVFTGYVVSFIAVSIFNLLVVRSRKNKALFLFSILYFVVVAPFLWKYFFKNIEFYGGGVEGFIEMLNHGFGFILLLDAEYFILPALFLVLSIVFFATVITRFDKLRVVFLLLLVAISGGVFGYSTMVIGFSSLTALVTYGMIYIYRFINKKYLS